MCAAPNNPGVSSQHQALIVLAISRNAPDATAMSRALEAAGYAVTLHRTDDPGAVPLLVPTTSCDLVIADTRVLRDAGMTIAALHDAVSPTPLMLYAETASASDAVAAMRAGVADYLVTSEFADYLGVAVRRALEAAERTLAADELRESEERFRLLAESVHDIIYLYRLQPTRGFAYINHSATAMTGYTPEEHYADPDLGFKIVHPDDHALLFSCIAEPSCAQGPMIVRWLRKDGSMLWTEQRMTPLYGDDGVVTAFAGIARDITAEQQVAHALRASEARLAESQRLAHLGSFEVDLDTGQVGWSDEMYRITGVDPGRPPLNVEEFLQHIDSRDRAHVAEFYAHAAADHAPAAIEFRFVTPSGDEKYLQNIRQAEFDDQGHLLRVVGALLDLTERNRLMDAVQRHAAELDVIFSSLPDPMLIVDAQGHVIRANPSATYLIGDDPLQYNLAGIITRLHIRRAGEPLPLEELPSFRALHGEAVANERLMARRHDGHEMTVLATASPLMLQGEIYGAVIVWHDITEQEALIEEVRRRIAELDSIISSIAEGVIIYAPDGRILRMNPAAQSMLGYTPEEQQLALPERAAKLQMQTEHGVPYPPEQHPGVRALQGETVYHAIAILHPPHRERLWVSISAAPIRASDGAILGSVATFSDITSRKQMELALAREVETNAVVAELARCLLTSASIAEMDQLVLGHAQRLTESSLGLIGYVDEQSGNLVATGVNISDGWQCYLMDQRTALTHLGGLWRWVFEHQTSLLTNDPQHDPRTLGVPEGYIAIRRFLTAPALVEGKMVGMVAVANAQRDYTRADLQAIERLATLYAIARQRADAELTLREALAREREQRETLDAIFTSAPVGMLLINSDLAIVRANDNTSSIFGSMGDTTAVGQRPGAALRCTNHFTAGDGCGTAHICQGCALHGGVARALQSGEPSYDQEIALTVRHGEDTIHRWLLANTVATSFEGEPHALVTLLDITARKQMELDLYHAREDAIAANAAKSEFLSRMSHELRTPLNAILGFAQLLALDASTPALRESTEQILKGGRHLLDLINEVLDIARIESGRLQLALEPVNLEPLITELIELTRPIAEQQRITMQFVRHTPCAYAVKADMQRLKQILLNFLSNAVKYNRPEGRVTISCAQAARGKRVRIAVADTGLGIPTHLSNKLFQPFERLEAEHYNIEGTGLGLALCKRLIEEMGGRIGVESDFGTGSTFWIELPMTRPLKRHPHTTACDLGAVADPACAKPRRILYIEDNVDHVLFLEQILARRPGLTMTSVRQNAEGLQVARELQPDVILVDYHLPDLKGEQILAQLTQDARTSGIPVVIISADAMPEAQERLLQAGAYAYLTKPIDIQVFHRLLQTIWQERER